MISQVNNSATPTVPAYSAYQPSNPAGGATGTGANTVNSPTAEPAVILDISAEGHNFASQKGESIPAIPSLSEPEAYMTGMKGTLVKLVSDVVNPKFDAATANKFTTELDGLIRGTCNVFGEYNETAEEHVVNREKGLKLAEYIAEICIDDPKDREKFLSEVKKFHDNAVLRDKGYTVIDGPDGTIVEKPGKDQGVYVPGHAEAVKAAYVLAKTTVFADDSEEAMKAILRDPKYEFAANEYASGKITLKQAFESARNFFVLEESIKILLHDPRYAEIAKWYDAGELTLFNAYAAIVWQSDEVDPKVAGFAEKKKEVEHTIERVKSTLDMDSIKEDVMNIIRDILYNSTSDIDYLKNMMIQPSKETAGHLV